MHEAKEKAQNFAQQIRKRQRENIMKAHRVELMRKQYPLESLTLEKYWDIPHDQLWKYVPEIQTTFAENYLLPGQDQEQQSLCDDLFYLMMEQPTFKLPRKIKFLRNESPLVASLVANVSVQIMPDELAYWIDYMGQEDKDMVYTAIPGQKFHVQTWLNHQHLKKSLMADFPYVVSAAEAVKEIVGFRRIHPSRLTTMEGVTLRDQLFKIYENQFEEMKEKEKFKTILLKEHLEITLWILIKEWSEPATRDLYLVFNNAICRKPELITSIFIIWLCEGLKKNPQILSSSSLETIISFLCTQMGEFDQNFSQKEECLTFLKKIKEESKLKSLSSSEMMD